MDKITQVIVEITWTDIECHGDGTWMSSCQCEEAMDAPFAEYLSVGYLLADNDKFMAITDSMAVEADGAMRASGNITKIPKGVIQRVKTWTSG